MSMPLETISVINTIAQFIVKLIPGLRGATQHLDDATASNLAVQYSEALAAKMKEAYGAGPTNGVIAGYLYTNTVNLIRGRGRWGTTSITSTAIGYLCDRPGTAGVRPPGHDDYLRAIIYIHAWWILRNMDADSNTEFGLWIVSDLNTVTLVPAIQAARYDPAKLDVPMDGGTIGGGAGGGTKSASILGALDAKTLLLIGVAVFIIAGVLKR